MAEQTNDNWAIERLVKHAWARVKDRLLSYILLIITSVAVAGISFFSAILVMTPLFLTKNLVVIGFVALPLLILLIGVGIYLGVWMQLASVYLITNEKNVGLSASLREVKPLIMDYFKFSILLGLITIGLMPWMIASLFILAVFWAFANTFVIFVYLKHKEKGLSLLWTSRAYYNQKFMAITGRIVIINVCFFMISALLNTTNNGALRIVSFLVSIVSAPFIVAYSYEIFRLLEKPKKVEASRFWIGLSIIGWIILVVLGGSLVSIIPKIPSAIQQIQHQNTIQQYPPLIPSQPSTQYNSF